MFLKNEPIELDISSISKRVISMSEKISNSKVLKYVLYFAVFCLIAGPWLTILWQEFGIGVEELEF